MKATFSILLGILFGGTLILSGAFSWSVIYDMFHFRSFHMFGIIFSAVGVAALSLWIIKRLKVRSVFNNPIVPKAKQLSWRRNLSGGVVFGLGWGIAGACSAPVFIILVFKWQIGIVLLAGAVTGVILYAWFEKVLLEKKK